MINLRTNGITESTGIPLIISTNQANVALIGLVGTAGQAMGCLGITYSQPEVAYGLLEYQTEQSGRLQIRLDK